MADPRAAIMEQAGKYGHYRYRLDPPPRLDDGTIDCSLYVLDVFKTAGLPFPVGVRTAEQIRQATRPIGWHEVKPGDLLFFEGTYNAAGPAGPDGHIASHVGISLGAGTMRMWDAHGRDFPHTDVAVTDISSQYWQDRLFDARRHVALVEAKPLGPDPWAWWSAERIAEAAQVPANAVRENWPRLVEQMTHAGIYEPNVARAVIGTIAKESASTFRPVREAFFLGEPEPAETHRKTLRYYPFFGRGFIQNTWRDAYAELGPKVAALWGADPSHPDFDFVSNPDKLLDPDFSAAAAAIFFRDKPGLLKAARAGDWGTVRQRVLGGPDLDGVARIERVANSLQSPPVPAQPPATPARTRATIRAEIAALLDEMVEAPG